LGNFPYPLQAILQGSRYAIAWEIFSKNNIIDRLMAQTIAIATISRYLIPTILLTMVQKNVLGLATGKLDGQI
jgi:hypothetical protein